VLGKPGGFGVTYLGWDLNLQTRVAIKEYLPRELAGRATDRATVAPHTQDEGEQFRYGLEQFLREARTLAQIDHPNIVRVRHFFEVNGTAYLVMDYYQGLSLAEHLERHGGRLPEEQAKQVMLPILDGLRAVHAKGFLHRDIKPQNIYLARLDSGGTRPILLDFGAARQAMGERSRSLSVVVSAGYAPFEQYHRKGNQGPWTDIYSAAAVIYRLVTGETPPEATERRDVDVLKPAAAFGVSRHLSDALGEALALAPERRPQTVRGFQARLWGIGVAPEAGPAPGPSAPRPTPAPAQPPTRSAPSAPPKARKTSAHSRAPASAPRRWFWPVVLGTAVALVGLGGWYLHRGNQWQESAVDQPFEAARVVDTEPAPVPSPTALTWTEPKTGMDFVRVPGGSFQMGCGGAWAGQCNDDEKPARQAAVKALWLARTEVTQAQWRAAMGSDPPGLRFQGCADCPVEGVSWNDAQAFIAKLDPVGTLGLRLPTEAEWEYACRSGGKGELYCGGSDLDRLAWYYMNSGGKTHPVGSKAANGLWLYDMSGNVWEWTCSAYAAPYDGAEQRCISNKDASSARVMRGGSWGNGDPRNLRAANRRYGQPEFRDFNLGLRLARTLSP
jgi:formylglycine-generating enzyme required for sulfatase activity/serine/threonine protein kinase